jgi:protein-L-isoaspartate(D-aspartate) O-methyltransferase
MDEKKELVSQWEKLGLNKEIINAFSEVPREKFVPISLRDQAYHDHPLPTIRNQSISQPTTIMVMLQALELEKGDKVFEIGAGGGYQASLMSKIVGEKGKIITTDVIPELVQIAKENLEAIGINNVTVNEADGSEGFPEEAPFDKIIITAACPTIPQPIIDQLKENGIIVAPVGDLESQTMVKGIKENGKLALEFLGSFRFVPMKGRHGFSETELFNQE